MKKETADKLLGLVKRNYQEIAIDFDKTRKKNIWPEIKALAASIKDGAKILDAGCGNGRLLDALQDKKIDYLGLDSSTELVKIAQNNYSNAKFLVADILNLQAVAATGFDYVFCLAVLQHLPSEELRLKALMEMKGKLKEGGRIVISVWNLWSSAKGKKSYRRLLFKNWFSKLIGKNDLDFGDLVFPWKNSRGEAVSDRYYHAFRRRELKNLAIKTGLNLREIRKDKFNYWLILD